MDDDRTTERRAPGGAPHDRPGPRPPDPQEGTFPQNAVVGIIADPRELAHAVLDLKSAGFRPNVLCGERGIERIETAGGSTGEVRLVRAVQELFGFEADHARMHTEALERGDFLVLVGADDDGTAERIGNVFADHGGRFVNHYTKWTSRTLIP